MMYLAVVLALLAAEVAAQACPQDRYDTRNAYELAEDEDGFDITAWNRAGANLIGTFGGNAVLDQILDTTTITGTGTFTIPNAFSNLATFDELEANGDQHFLVIADVATTVFDTHACFFEVGDISNPGGLCANVEGDLFFPNNFAITFEQHGSGGFDSSNTLALHVRRFADVGAGIIRLDIFSNVNGRQVSRTNLPAVAWDIEQGITIRAPDDNDGLTTPEAVITQVIVLEGREGTVDPTTVFNSAGSDADDLTQCRFQEWSTQEAVVIPGSGVDNMQLTLTTTNFGPDDIAAATANIEYEPLENMGACDGDFQISNFTSVTFSANVQFPLQSNFNGALQAGGLNFDLLTLLQSTTVTFTATVESNAATAIPLVVPGIAIDGQSAEIYVQRRSNLVFVQEDTRPFDLQKLPIAAGCDVPLTYTIDVFNEGPSCIENLVLETNVEVGRNREDTADTGVAVTPTIGPIAVIEPNELSDADPTAFSITATADAGNNDELDRSLHIVSPLDGGVSSADHPDPIDNAGDLVDLPDDSNVLNITYDVAIYADLQVTFEWNDDDNTVVAGDFEDAATPNLGGVLQVKNVGCHAVTDVELALTIDLPDCAFLVEATNQNSFSATNDDILDTANAFTQALSGDAGANIGTSNGNAPGPLTTGFRRINWDAGVVPFETPIDFFGRATGAAAPNPTRGIQFTSGNNEFRTSNDASGDNLFDSITPNFDGQFSTFSGTRTFSPFGENVFDLHFFVPGTLTPATVNGYGAVFVDVDQAGETFMEYFGADGQFLGTVTVPVAASGKSFAGATFAVPVARVRVTLGNLALRTNVAETGLNDVVIMDDFLYGEPVAIAATGGEEGVNTVVSRRFLAGDLDVNEARQLELNFAVCQCAKFSASGIRVIAQLRSAGDQSGLGDLSRLETTTPTNAGEADQFERVRVIRRFDDAIDQPASISLDASPLVVLECDEPKLVATSKFDLDNDESSSSSSSSSNDGDIDLVKLTRCRVTVSNNGASNVPLKIQTEWVLPSGSRFVQWKTSTGQFVDKSWALAAPSGSDAAPHTACPARSAGEPAELELDFASTRPGTLQIVARVETEISSATFAGDATLGNAVTINV